MPEQPEDEPAVAAVLAVVSAGGVLGSLARYGLLDAHPGLLTTLAINVVGSFLLGALVARGSSRPFARPFLGPGVLGGFTTMSTFAVQTVDASTAHAIAYAAGTLALGLGAAAAGRRVAA